MPSRNARDHAPEGEHGGGADASSLTALEQEALSRSVKFSEAFFQKVIKSKAGMIRTINRNMLASAENGSSKETRRRQACLEQFKVLKTVLMQECDSIKLRIALPFSQRGIGFARISLEAMFDALVAYSDFLSKDRKSTSRSGAPSTWSFSSLSPIYVSRRVRRSQSDINQSSIKQFNDLKEGLMGACASIQLVGFTPILSSKGGIAFAMFFLKEMREAIAKYKGFLIECEKRSSRFASPSLPARRLYASPQSARGRRTTSSVPNNGLGGVWK